MELSFSVVSARADVAAMALLLILESAKTGL
jgi:hypothetical protein